jgi:hypothetical protein
MINECMILFLALVEQEWAAEITCVKERRGLCFVDNIEVYRPTGLAGVFSCTYCGSDGRGLCMIGMVGKVL